MAIHPDCNNFIFPLSLRVGCEGASWRYDFARTRRTYVLGFMDAAIAVDRVRVEMVAAGLSPPFKEDPRRYIPLSGWREHFVPNGETFGAGNYAAPPPAPRHGPCKTWGAFGKDQPERAWLADPMRATDGLKCLAALYDAQDQLRATIIKPSPDGLQHRPGEVSLHPALFTVDGFNLTYYQDHFADDESLRRGFAAAAGLIPDFKGVEAPTLSELAGGLCVTHRTALALTQFVISAGLPALGQPRQDRSVRGTHRSARQKIKYDRIGAFKRNTADCAIELFA